MWSIGNEIRGRDDGDRIEPDELGQGDGHDASGDLGVQQDGGRSGANQAVAALLDLAGYNYGAFGHRSADLRRRPSPPTRPGRSSAARRSRRCAAAASTHTPDSRSPLGDLRRPGRRQCSLPTTPAASARATPRRSTSTRDRPFVAGEFIWTGFDYIGEPTPYALAVQELVLRRHRHGGLPARTSTTSTRAGGRRRPWSTSCRTGTGRPARRSNV